MAIKAKDIMATKVVTISPDDTVSTLAKLLNENRITGVPVVENNKIVGVISGTDVIKRCDYVSKELARFEDEAEYDPFDGCIHVHRYYTEELFNMKIRNLMSTPAYTMSPEDDIKDICKLMADKRVHRVTIAVDNEVVGLIATMDIVKLVAQGKFEIKM